MQRRLVGSVITYTLYTKVIITLVLLLLLLLTV